MWTSIPGDTGFRVGEDAAAWTDHDFQHLACERADSIFFRDVDDLLFNGKVFWPGDRAVAR